jgi:hypothetical protein
MTKSKFTIENEKCFYINNVIIYRVIIFFSDQHLVPLPAAVATRLRLLRSAVRTSGPRTFIRDSECLRKPEILTHISQDGRCATSVVSQSLCTLA